jgi:hypothetical protein
MIDGEAFLHLAIRLSAGKSEAEWRTSVSRSYYGAFHIARTLVTNCGVVLPETAESHRKLSICLRQSGAAEAAHASARLDSLRDDRNAADYDFSDARFQSVMFAVSRLTIAREIVDALAKCRVEDIGGKVRTAAKTLGLALVQTH